MTTVNKKDLQKFREEAFEKGIGPTTLIRMWVREKLYQSR